MRDSGLKQEGQALKPDPFVSCQAPGAGLGLGRSQDGGAGGLRGAVGTA